MPNIKNSADFQKLFNDWKLEMSKRSDGDKRMAGAFNGFKALWIYLFGKKRFITYMLKITSGMAIYFAMRDAWEMHEEDINKYLKIRAWDF